MFVFDQRRTKLYFKEPSKKYLGKLKLNQTLYRPGEALWVPECSGSGEMCPSW
jgi:hypothetical protein